MIQMMFYTKTHQALLDLCVAMLCVTSLEQTNLFVPSMNAWIGPVATVVEKLGLLEISDILHLVVSLLILVAWPTPSGYK
jgi:hypothetical protein